MRGKINALAETFRSPLSNAVQRELRQLRKRKLGREELVGALERLYSKYNLRKVSSRQEASEVDHASPRIVCSEALV